MKKLKRKSIDSEVRTGLIMLTPFLVLFFVFTILPIISSVYLSFCNYDMISAPKFSGLSNYIKMFGRDDMFPIGREYVDACIDLVKSVNPEIMVLPSAGISCGNDCYNIIMAGADGSGSSSGICKAEDPAAMAEEMMAAVRKAYDERNK